MDEEDFTGLDENKKFLTLKELETAIYKNDTAKEVYNIIWQKIIPELKNIKTFMIPIPLSEEDIEWSDYIDDYIMKTQNQNINNIHYMYFVFYLNKEGTEIYLDEPIQVFYSELNRQEKIYIIDLFERHLFGKYLWNGSNGGAMKILYQDIHNWQRIDKIKINNLLEDDGVHPLLIIEIETSVNLILYKDISREVVIFIEALFSQHDTWFQFPRKLNFTFQGFNNQNLDSLKEYIQSHHYIKSASFIVDKSKDDCFDCIWEYSK